MQSHSFFLFTKSSLTTDSTVVVDKMYDVQEFYLIFSKIYLIIYHNALLFYERQVIDL